MYARVTLLEIDTARLSMPAALERFRSQVLPVLREQEGYAGVHVLTNDEGKGLLLSLWETEQAADASVSSGYYAEQIAKFATVYRAPPGREHYQVALSDEPEPAIG